MVLPKTFHRLRHRLDQVSQPLDAQRDVEVSFGLFENSVLGGSGFGHHAADFPGQCWCGSVEQTKDQFQRKDVRFILAPMPIPIATPPDDNSAKRGVDKLVGSLVVDASITTTLVGGVMRSVLRRFRLTFIASEFQYLAA